jgi:hypothetical protein
MLFAKGESGDDVFRFFVSLFLARNVRFHGTEVNAEHNQNEKRAVLSRQGDTHKSYAYNDVTKVSQSEKYRSDRTSHVFTRSCQ